MENLESILAELIKLRKEQKAEIYTNQFKDTMQHRKYKKLVDKLIEEKENEQSTIDK